MFRAAMIKSGQAFYHITKEGQPIYIHKLSLMDIEFITNQDKEDIKMYYYILHEKMLTVLFPICSEIKGKRVDKMFSIYDLDNVALWGLYSKVYLTS